jgi:hypothetical protein
MALQNPDQPASGNDPKSSAAQPGTDADFDAAFATFNTAGADTQPSDQGDKGTPASDAGNEGKDAAPESSATADSTPQPKPEAPAKGAAADPAAAPAAEEPIDWTKVPPQFKAAYDAAQADKSRLEHSERAQRGRVSSLQRQLNSRAPATAPEGSGAGKPAAAKKVEPAKLKQIREDFPEMAPVVDGYEALADTTDQLIQDRQQRAEQDQRAAIQANEDELTKRHADWRTIYDPVEGPKFVAWLKEQPQHVQDLALQRNGNAILDVDAADDVLSRYKAFKSSSNQPQTPNPGDAPNNLAARRQRQLDGSESVGSRGGANGSGPADDFDAAFNYYASQDNSPKRGAAASR